MTDRPESHHGPSPAALEALLDAIHAAVIRGDLAALPELAARMDQLAGVALRSGSATAALRAKAHRNAACLAAAARGLDGARRRLREIASAAAGGSVYDGAGRPRRMTASAGRIATRL